MNQDVNEEQVISVSSKRIFKFHNVNRDKIFGNRKTKREESRKKSLTSSLSIEEEYKKKKAQMIFEQFVPIKQKSPENKGERGLRLVNIASLQEHPEKCPASEQESPLDLSNKSAGGPEVPLDLSLSSKTETKDQTGGQSDPSRLDLGQSDTATKSQPQSNNLQFLLLKNICSTPSNSFLNVTPSADSSHSLVLPSHVGSSVPRRDQAREIKREAPVEASQSTKPPKLPVPAHQPLQMVLSSGRVVSLLPGNTLKLKQERISDSNTSSYSKVNLKTDRNQNEVKLQPRNKKAAGTELMVKTNETVTKNGDLFCTFKNVKHMKMLKEQQSRRTSKKSKKS